MAHPNIRTHKYGHSSWNAGALKASQDGVPKGSKRCTKIADPRCQVLDGVHPLSNYYRNEQARALGQPNTHKPACKFCDGFLRSKRRARSDNIEHSRKYRTEWGNKKNRKKRFEEGIQILWDPSDHIPRGSLFTQADFKHTLDEGIWPCGMYFKDLLDNQCYRVNGAEKVEEPDRNWFEFIRRKMA